MPNFQWDLCWCLQVDVERRLDAFRQSVEHTNEKLTELTGVYDDVQVHIATFKEATSHFK